jgi:hypothetical protein
MGILDQISILRSPATADLKQNQYTTKMVQLVGSGLLRFTTLLSGACGLWSSRLPSAGLQQLLSRWILNCS